MSTQPQGDRSLSYIIYDPVTRPVYYGQMEAVISHDWLAEHRPFVTNTNIPVVLGVDMGGLVATIDSLGVVCSLLSIPQAQYFELLERYHGYLETGEQQLLSGINEELCSNVDTHDSQVKRILQLDDGLKYLREIAEIHKEYPEIADKLLGKYLEINADQTKLLED